MVASKQSKLGAYGGQGVWRGEQTREFLWALGRLVPGATLVEVNETGAGARNEADDRRVVKLANMALATWNRKARMASAARRAFGDEEPSMREA